MSERAQQLARDLAAANDELIGLLGRATPEQWHARTLDEGELRAVGVIAHHVAVAQPRIALRVGAFARGTEVPHRRPDLFDARNAQHARENPDPDQQATIELLRQSAADVAKLIASLTDAELDRTSTEDPGAPTMTTAEVIEQRQIGHVRGHTLVIAAALASH
jgi:DinB superfamily